MKKTMLLRSHKTALVGASLLLNSIFINGALGAGLADQLNQGSVTATTTGGITDVSQTLDHDIARWDSFNVAAGETVNFNTSASGSILNLIGGNTASTIQGSITSAGRVILVNNSGIVFTETAQVNVGSLIASSLSIDESDFNNGDGRYNFSKDSQNSGAIINRGVIAASQGIALIGSIVVNNPLPSSPRGGRITGGESNVFLGAGDAVRIDFDGDGLIQFEVTEALTENIISSTSNLLSEEESSSSAVYNGGYISGNNIILEGRTAANIFTNAVNHTGTGHLLARVISGGNIRLVAEGAPLNYNGSERYTGNLVEVSISNDGTTITTTTTTTPSGGTPTTEITQVPVPNPGGGTDTGDNGAPVTETEPPQIVEAETPDTVIPIIADVNSATPSIDESSINANSQQQDPELNIADNSAAQLGLFNVEGSGIKLPADQENDI